MPNPSGFQDPESWYSQLPTFYASVGALLTDAAGQPLWVKPLYRDTWTVPGGVIDHGETPEHAVQREVAEEVGITIEHPRLAVVDLVPPRGKRPKPLLYFLYDCGTADSNAITLQVDEIERFRFGNIEGFPEPLNLSVASCISTALTQRQAGHPLR